MITTDRLGREVEIDFYMSGYNDELIIDDAYYLETGEQVSPAVLEWIQDNRYAEMMDEYEDFIRSAGEYEYDLEKEGSDL